MSCDIRPTPAAIITGHKLRMLTDAGYTVVDKNRMDKLEKLQKSCMRCRNNGFELYADIDDALDGLEAIESVDDGVSVQKS